MSATASVPAQLVRCAAAVVILLFQRRLHLHRARVGSRVDLPDGRTFTVFRETSRDGDRTGSEVTLVVWFHLRCTPPGARWRRWLFERESILNTLLYAGFDGYRTKLWMVDPVSSDYAGVYAWQGADAARRYARYITTVLRPLSTPGSVGCQILTEPLAELLAPTGTPKPQPDTRFPRGTRAAAIRDQGPGATGTGSPAPERAEHRG